MITYISVDIGGLKYINQLFIKNFRPKNIVFIDKLEEISNSLDSDIFYFSIGYFGDALIEKYFKPIGLISKKRKIKAILHLHLNLYNRKQEFNWFKNTFDALNNTEIYVIVINKNQYEIMKQYLQSFKNKRIKLLFLDNPLPESFVRYEFNNKTWDIYKILYFNNLTTGKGVDTLFEVIDIFEGDVKYQFKLAGDILEDEIKYLGKDLLRKLKEYRNVEYLGQVFNDSLKIEIHEQSNIYIRPFGEYPETNSISMIESLLAKNIIFYPETNIHLNLFEDKIKENIIQLKTKSPGEIYLHLLGLDLEKQKDKVEFNREFILSTRPREKDQISEIKQILKN